MSDLDDLSAKHKRARERFREVVDGLDPEAVPLEAISRQIRGTNRRNDEEK